MYSNSISTMFSILIFPAVDCHRPSEIENGRVIVVNDTTTYLGTAEYHCLPQFNRIGPFLRKCMDDGVWSGEEPRCEVAISAQDSSSSGVGTAIGIVTAIIIILLVLLGILFLHR
jgi:hypothetical protein